MIRRIPNDSGESYRPIDELEKGEVYDYSDVIVKKPWGYEYLVFENKHVAIWLLHIARLRKTSMHCHPNKKTGLILLHGEATFSHGDGDIKLSATDGVVIEEGAFHSTEASSSHPISPFSENGIWVMEIESPPLKTDLVRKQDEYGRAGKSYEGTDNMVFEPQEILKFADVKHGEVMQKRLQDSLFTVRRGGFDIDVNPPSPDALVSIIGMDDDEASDNPSLAIGDLVPFTEFCEKTKDEDLSKYLILTIERSKALVKVSDYIFSYIASLGVKDVFAVSGGGAMHLVDSLGSNKDLNYVAVHHEQAGAMAAEGNSRITGKPGVALVTSGPGGTNAITGVCGAWIDSIPTIYISGQVTSDTLIKDTGLRQFGIQESNIVELVTPITKYAVTVEDSKRIRYEVEKAVYIATHGRPGPVWLDIPLNVQSAIVNVEELESFSPEEEKPDAKTLKREVAKCIELLKKAKRPVIISGYGIRLAGAEKDYVELVERLEVPIISSWTSSDLLPTDHENYVGRGGIIGDRAGNFTVQNSDLLLIIGSRMSIPQVGYNYKIFARGARKIMVDIADEELNKPSISLDLSIKRDAKEFIDELNKQLKEENVSLDIGEWRSKTAEWKRKYPVVLPEYKENKNYINSYHFIDVLSEKLDSSAVVVTDMGTSFTCTMQTFRTKAGQRLFTSSGHASMGFGLPGAIGACYGRGKRKTICIAGDGALQMNIQELETVAHNKLPIILFVLNNRGYLTIKLMQQNHFGKYIGTDPSSGVTCPDIIKLAKAHGIDGEKVSNQKELDERIDDILAKQGPYICEIVMSEDQALIPRVSSLKKADGSIVSKPLEDMFPFLDRDEFNNNMDVDTVEVLR